MSKVDMSRNRDTNILFRRREVTTEEIKIVASAEQDRKQGTVA